MAAPVAGQAFLRLQDAGNINARYWQADFSTSNLAAGSAVTVTVTSAAVGAAPPTAETALALEVYADNGTALVLLGTANLTPAVASQTKTVYLTSNAASNGTSECGMYVVVIHATQTAGLAATQYDVRSTGAGTTPTGFSVGSFSVGTIVGTTTITAALSTSAGGAKPAVFGYADNVWVRLTLGAPANASGPTVTTAVGATGNVVATMVAGTSVYDVQLTGFTDNRFPASSATRTTSQTYSLANVNGAAWLVPSSATQDTGTFDPRLTFTHLKQENDNTFATPPFSKDTGTQHLNDNLGFLNARVTNANGVGVNGVTWTATLQDTASLVAALTRSVTSGTQGGQLGWGASFLPWPDLKPPGVWNKTNAITAPSTATGLEANATIAYTMIAANPNLRIITGAGPSTVAAEAGHFSPGLPLLVGAVVVDTSTMKTVPFDTSPAPILALGRFNATLGRAEYLQADHVTWAATNGATIYFHPLTVSPGDSNAWTLTFTAADTSGWGNLDIYVLARGYVNGAPVAATQKEAALNPGINAHDAYASSVAWLGIPDGK